MSDLTKLTLAEARAGLIAKRFSATELTQAFLAAIEAGNAALNAYVLATPEIALSAGQESDARLAKGRRGRSKGCLSASRTSTAPRACAPPPAPTSSASSRPPTSPPSRRICGMPAPSCWASSTATSSPWARRTRPAASGRSSTPGGARGLERRPRSRRLLGRLVGRRRRRPLPRRHRHRHRRLDPPARRHHRHGRHQADLRPLLALGHRRLRLLAGPGRAHRQDRARRRHHAAPHGEPGPQGLHQRRCAGAGLRGGSWRAASRASRWGCPRNTASTACRARSRTCGSRASTGSKAAGRHHPRRLAAAHQVCAAGLLHRRPGRVLLQPRALRRRALRPAPAGRRPDRHLRGDAGGGLRRRGAPARADRHLRAVRRLLRRLLSQGAEGAHPHQARLRRGVRPGRRAADAHHARPRVRHRRGERRSRSRCTSTTSSP